MEKERKMDSMPVSPGTTMINDIITLIAPRHRSRDELPKGYTALRTPVAIDTEADIVRSIWDTLSLAPDTLVTLEDRCVVFWRGKRRKLSYHDSAILRGEIIRGVVKTR